MDRTNIITGPACITYKGQTFYTADDIELNPGITYGEILTSMHGKVDSFIDDIVAEISFTPAGQWIAAHLAVLFPYTNPLIGGSVFGAVDSDLVIQTLAGQQITYKSAALTGMPDLTLSATKTPMASVTIACIGANDTDWTDVAKRAVIQAQAFADASFDPAQIKMAAYSAALNGAAAPWDDIQTEEGWTISFDVALEPRKTDAFGTVDMTLGGVVATAKCVPVGISESELFDKLPLQGAGVRRGTRMSSLGADLTIAGSDVGDPTVTLKNAVLTTGALRFGQTALRTGEIAFESAVTFTAGVRNELFTVGSVAA